MKKKVVAALMSVAMVATLLAGCGSKAEDTTTATDTTATEDTADKADEAAADTKEGGHKFGYTYWAASDFFSTISSSLGAMLL